ncbi:ADP-ribose pyrophosphatase [Novosphingobium sp. KCTC 2891]|uniref:ADP-ribose pyrophosphatase n=1 Tax=Novosphingobium sp. KCTC 2891 TaxID=2989730 RepID=UPI002223BD20|nr:ADP-ribose pyrophosphatase [Novosphingobium sp. KCTC 2891]MCW1381690.1 ADP-ribose pyrophosphatase [Novosphingobium sp. KCTC 2891]
MAEIAARHMVYDGWYKFWRLDVRLPDGMVVERHLLDNGSAVAVLPYDPARRVAMLVSQPRAAVLAAGEAPLLEAIAGNLDSVPAEERIREEAMEEGGLRLGALEPVANIWPIPPVSTERVMLFLAEYHADDRVAEGGGADGEFEHISVHELPLDDLRAMVLAGELVDAKTLVLAQALLLRKPDLWR